MKTNGMVRTLTDQYSINDLLYDALKALGLPCNEEPTNNTDSASSYIIWRQTGRNDLTASGKVISSTLYFTVLLYGVKSYDHLAMTRRIIDALKGAGCMYATPGLEVWIPDLTRRECAISCALRVVYGNV